MGEKRWNINVVLILQACLVNNSFFIFYFRWNEFVLFVGFSHMLSARGSGRGSLKFIDVFFFFNLWELFLFVGFFFFLIYANGPSAANVAMLLHLCSSFLMQPPRNCCSHSCTPTQLLLHQGQDFCDWFVFSTTAAWQQISAAVTTTSSATSFLCSHPHCSSLRQMFLKSSCFGIRRIMGLHVGAKDWEGSNSSSLFNKKAWSLETKIKPFPLRRDL